MKNLPYRRQSFMGMTLLIIIIGIIIIFRGWLTDGWQWSVHQIRLPFNQIINNLSSTYLSITQFEKLVEENGLLKEKNIKLIQENNELANFRVENQQLKNLLNYQSINPETNYVTARIYSTDPQNFTDTIIIDKGERDDVIKNDHAIYNGMYLGKVISTTDRTAIVQLITDPGLKIVGEITRTQNTGIVHGQIGYGLMMEEISPDVELKIGQTVSTAKIDPNLPSGLLIGEIIEVSHEDQNIFQSAVLKPYFDIENLSYLMIQSNHDINP